MEALTITRRKLKYDYRLFLERKAEKITPPEPIEIPPEPPKEEHLEAEFILPEEKEPAKAHDPAEKPKKRKLELFETDNSAELARKIDELINSDGYYNEIRPADDGVAAPFEKKKKKGKSLLLIVSVAIFIAASVIIFINLRTLLQ